MLFVIDYHLDAVHQHCHQLSHSLGLGDGYCYGTFVEQIDLKGDSPFLLEDLAIDALGWHPVSFDELVLEDGHVVAGRFVGVGGQAEWDVGEVDVVVLEDGCDQVFFDLEGRFEVHGEGRQHVQDLGVIAEPSLAPADQVQVKLLLELFGHEGETDCVYYALDVSYQPWDGGGEWYLGGHCGLDDFEHVVYEL